MLHGDQFLTKDHEYYGPEGGKMDQKQHNGPIV